MNWNTTETTKELWLDGHTKKDGSVSLVNDFQQWKLNTKNDYPTAKQAWNAQQVTINELQGKLILASETLKRGRATIGELKNFIEENLKVIFTLEEENEKLKERLGDTDGM